MGILNHLFGSTESLAKNAEKDEEKIAQRWKEYSATVPEKEKIIAQLPSAFLQRKEILKKLYRLLDTELVDIGSSAKKEDEAVSDIRSLEHSQKIKRIHRLDDCLKYVETRYEYVHQVLRHLYSALRIEEHILKRLETAKDAVEFTKAAEDMKSELIVEKTLLEKIGSLKTFSELLSALVKGEHIIHTMDAKEKALMKKMQKGMKGIFAEEITEGVTSEWAMAVFTAIEDKVHDGVASGMFPGYHPEIDFEFTNRPEFVEFARETIQNIRKRKVSEQMLNIFVHCFRDWYNHER